VTESDKTTNALAYYGTVFLTVVKSFEGQAFGLSLKSESLKLKEVQKLLKNFN
jgi:hypothetical protein